MRDQLWRIPIPVPVGKTIVIQGRFPVTEGQWEHLQEVLAAMKPGLIEETTNA